MTTAAPTERKGFPRIVIIALVLLALAVVAFYVFSPFGRRPVLANPTGLQEKGGVIGELASPPPAQVVPTEWPTREITPEGFRDAIVDQPYRTEADDRACATILVHNGSPYSPAQQLRIVRMIQREICPADNGRPSVTHGVKTTRHVDGQNDGFEGLPEGSVTWRAIPIVPYTPPAEPRT